METHIHMYQNDLGAIIPFKPEITYNTTRTYKGGKKAPDGIELRFGTVRPTAELREKLKAHGFQFSERQVMWYALDNAKSRELIAYIETNDIEADDTQLEKRYLWAKIGSMKFYESLKPYTEFMVSGTPPRFFKNKKQLENSVELNSTIYSDLLKFKKFYNHKIGEGDDEEQDEEQGEEQEGEDHDAENDDDGNGEEKKQPLPKSDPALAAKLKALGEGMEKAIQSKLNSATSKQRPTAKRLRVASSMREEGYYLQNIQRVLYALSKAYIEGGMTAFHHLKHIRSKSQVELLNKYADLKGNKREDHYLQSVINNHSGQFKELGVASISDWASAYHQRDALLQTYSDSSQEQNRLTKMKYDELEIKIKGQKIPGFFPTPEKFIQTILPLLKVQKGVSILEPSAGKGDLLDALKEKYGDSVKLAACEIHYDLRQMLELKGYDVLSHDFLKLKQTFDRIIMNPPFENGQDIDHVTHALSLLNRNGRLVAIMGEGSFSRTFRKERAFRDMLFEKNAYVSHPIKHAFKDAFNQTGITVRIVVINQDGSVPDVDSSEDDDEPEDEQQEQDHLELEALAEMELLKMEIELKQKKQGLNGLGTVIDTSLYPAVWDIH